MQAARLLTRLQRELRMLQTDPPPGVCAWPRDDVLTHLEAQIQGPAGTVYSNGLFKLDVQVPERYPFEPPSVKFVTPIYHPNIDSGGRICLDILNMPPKGGWKPSLNIPTVLASIGLLLSEPNPDDGLMGDITAEYKHNRSFFDRKARELTEKHALPSPMEKTDEAGMLTELSRTKDSSLHDLGKNVHVKASPAAGEVGAAKRIPPAGLSGFGGVEGTIPPKQRLAIGKKLSLEKREQRSVDVNTMVPGPRRTSGDHRMPQGVDKENIPETLPATELKVPPVQQNSLQQEQSKVQAQNLESVAGKRGGAALTLSISDRQDSGDSGRLSLLSRLKLSRPRELQEKPPSDVIKEANCIIVSDSESEDEPVPMSRSRLSLTQRGNGGKRKASFL